MPKVIVIMGSISDREKVEPCLEILAKLGIDYLVTVSSAHRTPERTEKIIRDAKAGGAQVFICAAGLAAHLAGAVAARTLCPVIGIPISSGALGGQDALYSTVQMPAGFPVATMALDKAGAKNAAWLAAQILALNDSELTKKLQAAREAMAGEVENAGASIENQDIGIYTV